MTTPDPVTLAILRGRLEGIADEMDATLFRSAFNPIIAEAKDACHGLYHATTGETLVQGTSGLPIGHVSPEPPAGGAIGLVEEGDKILIDIPNRSISLLVGDDELKARRLHQDHKGWKPAAPRARKVSTALKAYALLATSADKGAVRNKPLVED